LKLIVFSCGKLFSFRGRSFGSFGSMKISEYAKRYGIPYAVAYRHVQAGVVPGAFQRDTGVWVIPDDHDFSTKPSLYALRPRDEKGRLVSTSKLVIQD